MSGGLGRRIVLLGAGAVLAVGWLGSALATRGHEPTAAEALLAGVADHRAGQLDDARRSYLEVLRSDPDNVYAYYDLGLLSSDQDDDTRAAYYYVLALGHDPSFVPALMNLGLLETEMGRLDEAIERYRQATVFAPNFAAAHYRLGVLLGNAGETKASELSLTAAKTLDLMIDDARAFTPSGPLASGSNVTPAAVPEGSPTPSPSPGG